MFRFGRRVVFVSGGGVASKQPEHSRFIPAVSEVTARRCARDRIVHMHVVLTTLLGTTQSLTFFILPFWGVVGSGLPLRVSAKGAERSAP